MLDKQMTRRSRVTSIKRVMLVEIQDDGRKGKVSTNAPLPVPGSVGVSPAGSGFDFFLAGEVPALQERGDGMWQCSWFFIFAPLVSSPHRP
jgi:hypothetical protein